MTKNEMLEILEIILKIFAIIGGLTTGVIFLKSWKKAYTKKMEKFFTGIWTNEGDISDINRSYYLLLNIKCDEDEINAYFDVRELNQGHEWKSVSLIGKRTFSHCSCNIIHFRNGVQVNNEKVKLRKKGKNIQWKLKQASNDLLPVRTILFRSGINEV